MPKLKPIKVGVRRRERRPGELASFRATMRNYCLECVGWNAAEVRRCSNRRCWSWPYRMGTGHSAQEAIQDELEHASAKEFPDDLLAYPHRAKNGALSSEAARDAADAALLMGSNPTRQ